MIPIDIEKSFEVIPDWDDENDLRPTMSEVNEELENYDIQPASLSDNETEVSQRSLSLAKTGTSKPPPTVRV